MAIILVTYDLKNPARSYEPLYEYLRGYSYCKGSEYVWLLDTSASCQQIRDDLKQRSDKTDKIFVARLASRTWASFNFGPCGEWLKQEGRGW